MDLIAKFEQCEIPNPKEPSGRYHRFVIDIDMNAVNEYVMYGNGDTAWPVKVIDALIDKWMEWAVMEQTQMQIVQKRSG